MPSLVIELPCGCSARVEGNKIIVECSDYTRVADVVSRLKRVSVLDALLNDLHTSSC